MPGLQEGLFAKSVIYMCAHGPTGAMGIVVNQKMPGAGFRALASQLSLPETPLGPDPEVHFGGPVETARGFVLHSADFMREDTVRVGNEICITATMDILRAITEGRGPRRSLFALGYAGWGPGQLEREMMGNAWLTAPATDELVFGPDISRTWDRALAALRIESSALSFEAGHA
jgi:putative transcriptional regulator